MRAAQAPDWVLLALLRWRSKSSIPGYGRLSFQAASTWLDQASAQNQTTLTAASLPSLSQEVAQIPNVLPESTYDYLDKAKSLHIDQVDLQSFMKASHNMMKMASWLNCKRFQTKMNLKSQKFLERGSLLLVKTKLLSSSIKGFRPALPYGVQMAKGLISS